MTVALISTRRTAVPAEREMRQALELIRDAAQNAESPETALIWIAALCDTTLRHAGMERAR